MLYIAVIIFLWTFAPQLQLAAQNERETNLTYEGQESQMFNTTTLDGKNVDLKSLRGTVVLVTFFTTPCEPCIDEMPRLEKDVWQKFKDKKFAMVAIGREHESRKLKEFAKKHELTFPIAGDPKRKIYKQFATQHVPRNYVIDAHGCIAFQSLGYDKSEFGEMIRAIQAELDKTQ
jgi:peroxiredoxin